MFATCFWLLRLCNTKYHGGSANYQVWFRLDQHDAALTLMMTVTVMTPMTSRGLLNSKALILM